MTTIDQRIVIPVSPDIVWGLISDIARNPSWQADCKSVTFLSQRQGGQGTRWRMKPASGRDQIIEITSWYDRLGYEYTIVDGAPFRESKGRIRLQEVPEGTVVQWTFNYEMGGVLGGVRDLLGEGRKLENTMEASLKMLWRQANPGRMAEPYEAKSLMRDGPDMEARATYKPRHPSVMDSKEPAPPITAQTPKGSMMSEPPISDEDTRPRPAVTEAPPPVSIPVPDDDPFAEEFADDAPAAYSPFAPPAAQAAPPTSPSLYAPPVPPVEPVHDFSFDDLALSEPPVQASDTQPIEHHVDFGEIFGQPDDAPAAEAETDMATEADIVAEAPPASTGLDLLDELELETSNLPPVPQMAVTPEPPEPPVSAMPDASKKDTAHASIWEVFGVPRPSETQETKAAQIQEPAPEAESPAAEVAEAVPEAASAETEFRRPTPEAASPAAATELHKSEAETPPDEAQEPEYKLELLDEDADEELSESQMIRLGLRAQLRRNQVRLRRQQ